MISVVKFDDCWSAGYCGRPDPQTIAVWKSARPEVRATALVILGWDSRWGSFPNWDWLLDFENPTDDGEPAGFDVIYEAGYFHQSAVNIEESQTQDRTDYLGINFWAAPLNSEAGTRARYLTADIQHQHVPLKTALVLRTMAPAATFDDVSPDTQPPQ